ncbi:dynein axonemal assembly factor 8 isoform X3 [Pangasianodon hypophthalmus]|uniref:dynein axonemal assembly factor 8 isoform X3 n=1 Tax=Pangasianodon hypophthalmus TaxID=310915 RepID=UPI00230789F6|nr:dynein axonemal assembly factor 8 isoform X3 [Pangasianodon hypophthalmus]
MQNSSFFDSIKSQLPSPDFDSSSSSDNEEELSIYQRPSLFKFPDGTEFNLDVLSLEELGTEDLLEPETQPFPDVYDNGLNNQEDDVTPQLSVEHRDNLAQVATGLQFEKSTVNSPEPEKLTNKSEEHPKSPTLVHQEKKSNSDTKVAEGTSLSECTKPKSERFLQTSGEVCKTQSVEKKEQIHTRSYPVLSLKPLENWDLDLVLQSLKQHGHRKHTTKQEELDFYQLFKYTDDSRKTSEVNIMEQLAAYCRRQACKDTETETISVSKRSSSRSTTTRKAAGQTDDFNDISSRLHLKNKDPPTIYIDLRNTEHQTKSTVIFNTSTHAQEDLPKQVVSTERVGDKHTEAVNKTRMLSGKSLLLQKIKEANQTRPESSFKRKIPEDSAKPAEEMTSGVVEAWHRSVNAPSDKQPSGPAPITTACDESIALTDKTLKAAVQSQKDESDHMQKNRAQRQQYLKYLLTFRPQQSTNRKQSAAEMTDVLYDTDGSYLPSVSTLPSYLKSSECLLLMVPLLSPGVVAGQTKEKAQTVESTSLLSHVYNSLIAWFMSLAKPSSCSADDSVTNTAPFWVTGLQQFWKNDSLVLYICAVPPDETASPRKFQNMKRGWTSFHQRVSKFLAQTQLRTVASWLPELNHLLEQQAHPALVSLPSSRLDCFVSISSDKEPAKEAFGTNPGFYWQTLSIQEQICQWAEATTSQQPHTEVMLALVYQGMFHNPLATHHTLQLLFSSGLDVCGLRFAYPCKELLANSAVLGMSGQRWFSEQPLLAMAIRGPRARAVWQEITGPSDPMLARKTDPASINALHCHCQERTLFHSPRLDSLVHLGLCVWFGGRLPNNDPRMTAQVQCSSDRGDTASSPTMLCATAKADVFLLVSPVVPPCCYSFVLASCAKRGFQLTGLQRVQISNMRASSLGLNTEQMLTFCHAPVVSMDEALLELFSHCLVLLLRRENALRHTANLPTGLMNELALQGLVGLLRTRLPGSVHLTSDLCFHAIPYMEDLFNFLGDHMWTVPDFSPVVLSKHRYPSCSETEQIVILTLTGHNIMEKGMSLLHKVLRGNQAGGVGEDRFELLALKWLPTLSWQQAQELSPFEVSERQWHNSVVSLVSCPALVCAVRRPQAFTNMQRLLPQDYPGDLSVLMSSTPEMAFRQATLFFTKTEMIPDHSSRIMFKFLPPPTIGSASQSLFSCMTEGSQPLLTLALFKPGVWSHYLGKILSKIQQNSFTVVGLRMLVLNSEMANTLMNVSEHQDLINGNHLGEPSERDLELKYLTSGPVLALCLQRVNAVKRLLELLGPEDPAQARLEDLHFWRASYGTDRLHNGIYGSVSYPQAVQDLKLMFPEGVCCTETSVMKHEQIRCLRSDPVASLERQQSHTIANSAKNNLFQSLMEKSELIGAGFSVRSALCQTTCLIMPSCVLQLSRPPLHLDLLQRLLSSGCHVVAGRLCSLDQTQITHLSLFLMPTTGKELKEPLLCEGPCLLLALQMDNIVTCFDLILERVCRDMPDLEKVRKMLLYPGTEPEAVKLLCYLFDVLSPDSHHSIVPQ